MKLIMSLSTTFIFCFCIGVGLSNGQTTNNVSPELAAARAKYDTPFIKKYKKYYEANDVNLLEIFVNANLECMEKCSEKDFNNLQIMAAQGDKFAISMLPYAFIKNSPTGNQSIDDLKIAGANNGSSVLQYSIASYYFSLKKYDLEKKYANMAKEQGYFGGYRILSNIYARNNDMKNYCKLMKEGYTKYGMEFLAFPLINSMDNDKNIFLKCTKHKPDEILNKAGQEGQLIKGYFLAKHKKYDEAYKIFMDIYNKTDSVKFSANAGYCLGMMIYYGKGVKQNKVKGRAFLHESFNKGVYYSDTPEQVNYSLPGVFKLISYNTGYYCNQIK